MLTLKILVVIVVLLAGAWLVWRMLSRRRSLPCPRWLGFFLDNPIAISEARKQIERAELQSGMDVLDIGCGTGRLTIPSARFVGPKGRVLAVDIQQDMLDTVQARGKENGLENIQIQKVVMGEGMFDKRDVFDRAFLTTVLGEIQNQLAALQEIYAALKPGGILSIAEILFDPHFQSLASVRARAQKAGFRYECKFGNRFDFTIHFVKPK
jgi:ubiquinone/menaquinone biosynthesis C-methylase UbiE